MKYCAAKLVVLTLLLSFTVSVSASAGQFKALFGDEFAMVDLTLTEVGPIEVGLVGAVDYFVSQSRPLANYHLDIKEDYEGLLFKAYVPMNAPVKLYGAYKPMVRAMDFNRLYNVLEAGVEIPINACLSVGAAYQYCDKFTNDDRFLLTTSWMF